MRLYYMTQLETAIEHILPERRMRIAQFDQLNDPFELLSAKMGGANERIVFKRLREHWIRTLGVICMGRHWKSPLMWAHYAKSHAGICLGFDVPDDKPKRMNYEPGRLQLLIDTAKPAGGFTLELLEKVLTTKYAQWAYEEEWRLFSNLEERDPVNGHFYVPFGPVLSLREIIVGARCAQPVGSFKKLLGQVKQSVTIIKARPAFESFEIVTQKRVSPITVHPKT
jgi:hypothetical protein